MDKAAVREWKPAEGIIVLVKRAVAIHGQQAILIQANGGQHRRGRCRVGQLHRTGTGRKLEQRAAALHSQPGDLPGLLLPGTYSDYRRRVAERRPGARSVVSLYPTG